MRVLKIRNFVKRRNVGSNFKPKTLNKKIKLKKIKLFLYCLCVLTIISCNSNLSSEKILDITLIGATIDITQNPIDSKKNWMTINLFDKDGKTIRNDSLTIIVNNIETSLKHHQGLYYNDDSEYYIEVEPINQMYIVEVKLSDGKRYFLGSVRSLKEEKIENIECNEVGDINNDFLIKWNNLNDIDELSVFISMADKTEPNITAIDYKEEKIIKINENGRYTIPKSEYRDIKSTINGIEFDFRTTKSGKTNPKLLEDSKITIKTLIEKNVRFE